MNDELFVRVAGGVGSIAVLFGAFTIGALLGNTPDEILAWFMIGIATLSTGALILISRFENKTDSLY